MKLLVTGATGFIGGNVAKSAVLEGYSVVGIGKSERPSDCKMDDYIRADIINSDLAPIIKDFSPDVVFHGAGPASVASSICAPVRDLREATLTWASVLDGIRRSGTDPLVLFPSSAAVHGNALEYPTSENSPVRPISPYGFHKAACELISREYSECFNINIIVLRFFSLFGPRQHRHLVWEVYQQLIGEPSAVWLKGTGKESRDYLYIDDAVEAILNLVQIRSRLQTNGRDLVINLASGRTVGTYELADQLRKLVAPTKSVLCRGVAIRGDPEHMCADIGVLRSLIPSWAPRPLQLALVDCVALWKGQGLLS